MPPDGPSHLPAPQLPGPPSRRKLYIKTWGCQMNVYDSQRMADVLAPLGFDQVDQPDGADMAILNTCHIREKATEKVFSDLGRLKAHKQQQASEGKRMLIAVAGCVAQAEGAEIMSRAPSVDLVLGPQTYHRLPEMVAALNAGAGIPRPVHTDFPPESKFDSLPQPEGKSSISAFLSVQEGCDKFCSFCVVPYTRGAEFSRPAESVLREARALLRGGAREITLLGQNVNAYHGTGPDGCTWSLARLIHALAECDGVERIRYTTSHPRDMSDDLIAAHRDVPQLMPFLHLPVQSGSDKILDIMNRKHLAEEYLRTIDKLREARSDLALSSDFIVGYPGETEEDFGATMRLVETVGFASAYSFKYSARPGTPAAKQAGLLPEREKDARLQTLQALLQTQQLAYNRSMIGRTLPVLFDRAGAREGQLHGRTPYMQAVHVNLPEQLLGHTIEMIITGGHPVSLTGSPTDTAGSVRSQ